MKKLINEYISNRNRYNLLNVDFHELIELIESGSNDMETGKEIGVTKECVNNLFRQLKKETKV